jgi:leader peptidase (prepilin peptidase)/N-methyltransferase
MLARKEDSKLAIPFGPFLALGSVVYIFFGSRMIHWYLSISGFTAN